MIYDPQNMTTQQFLHYHKKRMTNKPTKAEQVFKECLDRHQVNYVFQKMKFKKGIKRIFDFWIRFHKIIVEIDGGYHNSDDQKIKDKWRQERLIKHGKIRNMLRFTNEDVLQRPDYFISKVIEHIKIASDYHPTANDRCIGSSDDLNSLEVGACANEIVVES